MMSDSTLKWVEMTALQQQALFWLGGVSGFSSQQFEAECNGGDVARRAKAIEALEELTSFELAERAEERDDAFRLTRAGTQWLIDHLGKRDGVL